MKTVIYFGRPGKQERINEIEKLASDFNMSKERAWIELCRTMTNELSEENGGFSFFDKVYSDILKISVRAPDINFGTYSNFEHGEKRELPMLSISTDLVEISGSSENIEVNEKFYSAFTSVLGYFFGTDSMRFVRL